MTKPRLAVLACGLALALAACTPAGTSGGSPSGSVSVSGSGPVSAAVLCADAEALRASVTKLQNVTVSSGAENELRARASDVKANLAAFIDDARGQWQVQIEALRAALVALDAAIDGLSASNGTATVTAVRAAVGAVGLAAQNLFGAVRATCSSVSPSAQPS